MKTEQQIKQKKLELYEAREKYFLMGKQLQNKKDEILLQATLFAGQVITEKISLMEWVLKDD